jgi:hypothetical protein
MAATRPLVVRLRAARNLLQEWRITLYEGEKSHDPGPAFGTVDKQIARELARFDEARDALAEAIKATKKDA